MWARLMKGVLGTDHVDAQLGDGLPAEVVLGLPRAAIADLDRARGHRAARPRPEGRAPGPAPARAPRRGRPRRARSSRSRRTRPGSPARPPRCCATRRATPARSCRRSSRALAGDGTASGDGQVERAVERARRARPATSSSSSVAPSLAESPASVVQAAAALAALPGVKFLSALRRGNVHGALDLGLTPGFLPGRTTLDAGREHVRRRVGRGAREHAGSTPPASSGPPPTARSTRSCCSAPTSRPTSPTARSSRAALDGSRIVDRGRRVRATTPPARADVFLPDDGVGREDRHACRTSRVGCSASRGSSRPRAPRWTTGASRPSSRRASASTSASTTVDDVQDEIARVAPAFAGVDAALVRRARDGAVLPIAEHPDEIVLHSALGVERRRVVGADPARRRVRRDAPVVDGHGRGRGERHRVAQHDQARAHRGGRRRRRARARARRAAAADLGPRPRSTSGTGAAPTDAADPPDAYSLRLVAARTLYDAGSTAAAAPAFAGLAAGAALVVHPSDLARIGVDAEGDEVRVTSARGTVTLPVRTDAAVAPGTAFLPFARPGSVGAERPDRRRRRRSPTCAWRRLDDGR